MRVLVVSNMLGCEQRPERGRFVRDQVAALRQLDGLDIELYEFGPGPQALAHAARKLHKCYRRQSFDVVHAHFGLTAWPALAVKAKVRGVTLHGTDLAHPRTRAATRAVLPLMDLVATASEALIEQVPGRARRRAQALPCGVDTRRFSPIDRARARAELSLDRNTPVLLFPADPARPEKRCDRAQRLADACGARLLTLGGVEPERVCLYVNAASAVLVPSEREGFGLAALEALACDVPVLATPVGVHPRALEGIDGCLCAPFDLQEWSEQLSRHLNDPDPRVPGRRRAERFSTRAMAERLAGAWRTAVADAG